MTGIGDTAAEIRARLESEYDWDNDGGARMRDALLAVLDLHRQVRCEPLTGHCGGTCCNHCEGTGIHDSCSTTRAIATALGGSS